MVQPVEMVPDGLDDAVHLDFAESGERECKHLFVLCHGLWGFGSHMGYLAKEIKRQKPEAVTLIPDNYPLLRTYDGAHVCAMRTLRQMRDFLKGPEGRGVTHVSLVGYSFGGLVCRYLAGLLLLEDFLGLVPVNFLTMATPHLGVMRSGWFDTLTALITGDSGRQMVCRDDEGLLLWTTMPGSIFARGLARFARRVMFGNARGDRPVPTHTAVAIPEHRLDPRFAYPPEGDFPSAEHPHVWHVSLPEAAQGGEEKGEAGASRAAALEARHPFLPRPADKSGRRGRESVLQLMEELDRKYNRAGWLMLLVLPLALVWVCIVPPLLAASSAVMHLLHGRTERREAAACPPRGRAPPASYLPGDLIGEAERREVARVRSAGTRAMQEFMAENLDALGWYRAVCGLPTGVPTVHGHIIVRRERFQIGRDCVDLAVRGLLPAAAAPRRGAPSPSRSPDPPSPQSAFPATLSAPLDLAASVPVAASAPYA